MGDERIPSHIIQQNPFFLFKIALSLTVLLSTLLAHLYFSHLLPLNNWPSLKQWAIKERKRNLHSELLSFIFWDHAFLLLLLLPCSSFSSRVQDEEEEEDQRQCQLRKQNSSGGGQIRSPWWSGVQCVEKREREERPVN